MLNQIIFVTKEVWNGRVNYMSLNIWASSRILESETIESSHWLLTKRLHFRPKFPNLDYLF